MHSGTKTDAQSRGGGLKNVSGCSCGSNVRARAFSYRKPLEGGVTATQLSYSMVRGCCLGRGPWEVANMGGSTKLSGHEVAPWRLRLAAAPPNLANLACGGGCSQLRHHLQSFHLPRQPGRLEGKCWLATPSLGCWVPFSCCSTCRHLDEKNNVSKCFRRF